MSGSIDVRIAWEHTHREMLSTLLVCGHWQRSGRRWRVEHVVELAAGGGPEVVYFPFYYDASDLDAYLRRCGGGDRWVVNMAWEQVHADCARGYMMPDGDFAREAMLHCAWGPRFAELLVDHGIPPEHVRLTGNPRMDIYRHPEILFSRGELAGMHGLDADKPWILLPHNFNLAYIKPAHVDYLRARKYAMGDDFIGAFVAAREAFVELVYALCETFPAAELIARTHPAGYESAAHYGRRPMANLHVIADWDIANWIRQAALVVVWSSTSAVEGIVAGVPTVSYEPFPFSEVFGYDVGRIAARVAEVADVFDVVRGLPDPRLDCDRTLLGRWYAFNDGRNTERMAAVAAEADADFGRFATRIEGSLGPGARIQGAREKVAARWRGPEAVRTLLRGYATRRSRAPDAAALREAVETSTATPLGDFLR